jgi:hypothetical protein
MATNLPIIVCICMGFVKIATNETAKSTPITIYETRKTAPFPAKNSSSDAQQSFRKANS